MKATPAPSVPNSADRSFPHVIAITSGKGGVGKSSIGVNLGIALVRRGARVCILDADTGLANVNILLGLTPRLTLEHVLVGSKTIEEVMLDAPGGLKVIPGANGISECVTLQPRQQLRLVRELARIETEFDYLLLDTAAGIADSTLDFVASSHRALIVVTPEPTSLTDAFSLIKLMARRRRHLRYEVVVNMCASMAEGREVYQRFSTAVTKYIGVSTTSLGFMPRDESLRNAVTLQHPVALFPESDPSSRAFIRLADAVRDAAGPERPRLAFSDYWQRQFRQGREAEATSRPTSTPGEEAAAALSRVQAECVDLIRREETATADLAATLGRILEAYVERHGRGALDLAPVLQRLTADSAEDPELARWAAILAPHPAVALPKETNVIARNGAEEANTQGGAGMSIAPGGAQDVSASLLPPFPPAPRQRLSIHGYDQRRFGSQQDLIDRLRNTPFSDLSLADLLGQWDRASSI